MLCLSGFELCSRWVPLMCGRCSDSAVKLWLYNVNLTSLRKQLFLLAPCRLGRFATQRQKFHTDDVNQCLHNKFSNHGVPNANVFNFTFLLVDFGKMSCSFANTAPAILKCFFWRSIYTKILTVLLQIHCIYILPLQPFVLCLLFETMARTM